MLAFSYLAPFVSAGHLSASFIGLFIVGSS